MKLFFAGAEKGKFQDILYGEGVRNILMSFYWSSKGSLKEVKDRGFNIFVDSGGYSARKSGADISVEDYGKFLERNKDYIFTAANLDVTDLEKSNYNQKHLEQFYPVLPVFHFSEYVNGHKDLFEEFCKKYKYVAIGGLAGIIIGKIQMKNFLNFCFKTVIKYKTKVHGFGTTSINILKEYPFYTVDSTAWLTGGQYGTMTKWNNDFKMDSNIHYTSKDKILKHNIPVANLDKYEERLKFNVREMLKMEKAVTEMWKINGIDYGE